MVPVTPAAQRTPRAAYLASSWDKLHRRVTEWRPDIVVLVARKMPRLAEYLRLDFAPGCLVISDLAIPFAHHDIRHARVAILDDIVNVGTTVRHAYKNVMAAGAVEARVFVLARSQAGAAQVPLDAIHPGVFPPESYRKLVRWIPSALRTLAKPFEIEFPVIRCRFALPFSSSAQILCWLRDRFGSASVHDLTAGRPFRRVTVDLPSAAAQNAKLRLYFHDKMAACNLVPFAVPRSLSCIPTPKHSVARRLVASGLAVLESCPRNTQLWDGESSIRLRLFAASLDAGIDALDGLGEILVATQNSLCDLADARLLLGPRVAGALDEPPNLGCTGLKPAVETAQVDAPPDPLPDSFFLRHAQVNGMGFVELVRASASALDPWSIFASVFDTLAHLVGALDPSTYSLGWPYTLKEIDDCPYLRLRVGPTFQDLVAIVDELLPNRVAGALPARNLVSAMLDEAIDSGAVVPTIARYGEHMYRIYRKGETDLRDEAVDRIAYAWLNYDQPMTLTRLAKINAILAYSNRIPQTLLPCTLERGNAGSLQATSLDSDGPEVGQYMRNTGRLIKSNK